MSTFTEAAWHRVTSRDFAWHQGCAYLFVAIWLVVVVLSSCNGKFSYGRSRTWSWWDWQGSLAHIYNLLHVHIVWKLFWLWSNKWRSLPETTYIRKTLGFRFPGLSWASFSAQVVSAALDAARHRRQRVDQLQVLATPTSDRSGSKRKDVPRKSDVNVSTVSTTASSSGEKVTPDAKHIRTDDAPEPKVLFKSPDDTRDHDGLKKAEVEGQVALWQWLLSKKSFFIVVICYFKLFKVKSKTHIYIMYVGCTDLEDGTLSF